MNLSPKRSKKSGKSVLVFNWAIILISLSGAGFLMHLLHDGPAPHRTGTIIDVSLLKPAPAPERKIPEQKPAEPEPPKEPPKQVVDNITMSPRETPVNNQSSDNAAKNEEVPAEDKTGGPGDGSLPGMPGGQGLTLGRGTAGGRLSLYAKYGWYTKKIEKELWRVVGSILENEGGIPAGSHNATVHLLLNGKGAVVGFRILDPSGNEKIDRALKAALASLKVNEPLPEGMPGGLTIRVSSHG